MNLNFGGFFFFITIQEPGFCTNACRVASDSGGSLCTSPSLPATNSTRSCASVRASWTICKRQPTSHLRYAPVSAATGQFTEWRTCTRLRCPPPSLPPLPTHSPQRRRRPNKSPMERNKMKSPPLHKKKLK
jgi:hypothetical protein